MFFCFFLNPINVQTCVINIKGQLQTFQIVANNDCTYIKPTYIIAINQLISNASDCRLISPQTPNTDPNIF